MGLSLVSDIAQLHGAEIIFEDNLPGLGVRLLFSPLQEG